MSHFTVLVLGENPEKQLESYDETLEFPRYVKYTKQELIQKGKEEIENYKNSTYKEYLENPEKYKSSCKDNEAHLKYVSEEFPLKFNWSDEEIYQDQIRWYEPEEIGENGEIYSTSNPNSKWDWYELGGRWTGFFKLKRIKQIANSQDYNELGFTHAEFNQIYNWYLNDKEMFDLVTSKYGCEKKEEITAICENITNGELPEHEIGRPGIMTECAEEGTADSTLKKYIDFDGMIAENREKAVEAYDKFEELLKNDPEKAKNSAYWEYGIENISDSFDNWIPETREDYIERRSTISTFAVVKDGKWYEKGKMGWWACVSDEKAKDEWAKEFNKLLAETPDDTLISLYDCHI